MLILNQGLRKTLFLNIIIALGMRNSGRKYSANNFQPQETDQRQKKHLSEFSGEIVKVIAQHLQELEADQKVKEVGTTPDLILKTYALLICCQSQEAQVEG